MANDRHVTPAPTVLKFRINKGVKTMRTPKTKPSFSAYIWLTVYPLNYGQNTNTRINQFA